MFYLTQIGVFITGWNNGFIKVGVDECRSSRQLFLKITQICMLSDGAMSYPNKAC